VRVCGAILRADSAMEQMVFPVLSEYVDPGIILYRISSPEHPYMRV
jgi:hypothetical protein